MSADVALLRKPGQRAITIRPQELSAGDIRRWASLASASIEPNPFFEPAFVLAAAEHLGDRDLSLLVVESADRWTACLPVRRLRLAGVPVALRSWCHAYCFLGTPLLDADAPEAAARGALVDLALAGVPGARAVRLEGRERDCPRLATGQLALEHALGGGHRNLAWEPNDAVAFDLTPGEGVYVAPHAPHWVQNGGEVSVSLSITFATAASENRRRVHSINARLRRLGLSPTLPGRRPGADRGKAACSRALGRVRQARA